MVTVTVTAPALPAGVVAVMLVLLTTTLVAAVPPNVTVAPAAKFVPVIVTAVPPAVDPLLGATLLTVGTGPETGANDAMMTPVLAAPSEIVVMLTFPAGETGDPLLTKIPAPPNCVSVSIGVAPAPAARCP